MTLNLTKEAEKNRQIIMIITNKKNQFLYFFFLCTVFIGMIYFLLIGNVIVKVDPLAFTLFLATIVPL